MKTLQSNFTNSEQSKRLLELGVPAWTADFYFFTEDSSRPIVRIGEGVPLFPCWSVGRLMEIYCILRDVKCIFSLDTTDIIDNIIACFERNKLDFSKLDEYDTRN